MITRTMLNLRFALAFLVLIIIAVVVDVSTALSVHNVVVVATVIAVTIPALAGTTMYLGQLSIISELRRQLALTFIDQALAGIRDEKIEEILRQLLQQHGYDPDAELK